MQIIIYLIKITSLKQQQKIKNINYFLYVFINIWIIFSIPNFLGKKNYLNYFTYFKYFLFYNKTKIINHLNKKNWSKLSKNPLDIIDTTKTKMIIY